MSSVAIDTLSVAQQFQEAGFNKKQAAGAAHILANLLSERAGKDETGASLSLLAAKIDGLEKRHGAKLDALQADVSSLQTDVKGLQTGFARMETNVSALQTDVSALQTSFARMEAMLAKLLDGQAILLQNDMELKRRLDERG